MAEQQIEIEEKLEKSQENEQSEDPLYKQLGIERQVSTHDSVLGKVSLTSDV